MAPQPRPAPPDLLPLAPRGAVLEMSGIGGQALVKLAYRIGAVRPARAQLDALDLAAAETLHLSVLEAGDRPAQPAGALLARQAV